MSSKIIDGKKLAAQHESALHLKVKKLKNKKPKVVSILVGEDPMSLLYSNLKQKKATELGIDFEIKQFAADTNFEEVAEEIVRLNKDRSVTGIMVQLPLPRKFLKDQEESALLLSIAPKKDVDGLTGKSLLPAVVKAILAILEDEKIKVSGKDVTIIGSPEGIGKPLEKALKKLGAKVAICDINDPLLRQKTLQADILISAKGEPGLVIGRMVKEGVIVIDVGISKVDGGVVGDIDFESVEPLASKITPVPGGVGPVTVISLMENAVELCQ